MSSPAVASEICLAMIRECLAGYRGYPFTEAGEKRFAAALQANAVSVDHARATLAAFDELFPTVKQIHDTSFALRPQFDPTPDPREEWERQYGKPQSFEMYPADEMACHWQAVRDALYYTEGPGMYEQAEPMLGERGLVNFWRAAMAYSAEHHSETVEFVRDQVASLGWLALMRLAESPTSPVPYRKLSSSPRQRGRSLPKVTDRVTESDIQRALRESRNATAVAEAEDAPPAETGVATEDTADDDGWDDPDR